MVLLRPPPSTRSRGGLGQISDLIDIDYETLILLLGVAGAGASWVLYQTILTKGRRSFKNVKEGNIADNTSLMDKLSDFINFGERLLCSLSRASLLSNISRPGGL